MVDLKILRQLIKDASTQESTADILSLFGYSVGRDWKFCLREERTPSASIHPNGITISDFGGDFTGDVVALLNEYQQMGLKDATLFVCEQMGINTDEHYEHRRIPVKRKTQPKPELTQARYSEIMAELSRFDQSQQSFSNPDYAAEALAIAPIWVWQQADEASIALFRELTTFDQVNKTLVMKIHDYSGKIISYKRRRFRNHKWSTAAATHPNSQCIVSITNDTDPVYILEGHRDALTAILLGINFIAIPTVGYKVFGEGETFLLSGRDVVFVPDLKRGDTQGTETMTALSEQVEAKSTNIISIKKALDLMDIEYDKDSIDLSDAVEVWDRGLGGFKSTLLFVCDKQEIGESV